MIFIIGAAVFYAIAIIFSTVASRKIDTNLAAGLGNLISAIIPIIVAAPLLNKRLLTVPDSRIGVIMEIFAGIFVALFTMALTKSFSINKVAIVVPIVFGGSIFLSAILSYFFLKEKITITEGFGLLVLGVGLGIITYARLTAK